MPRAAGEASLSLLTSGLSVVRVRMPRLNETAFREGHSMRIRPLYALLFTLSAISEAEARDCLEVINPETPLLVKFCDRRGDNCSGSRTYRNVQKVEDLNQWKFDDSNGWPPEPLRHVRQNYPGPTQSPPQPSRGGCKQAVSILCQ